MTGEGQAGISGDDPLWVPLLTHYRDDGEIDFPRMAAHLGAIRPNVRQLLLAGSTGDGWELGASQIRAVLDFGLQQEGISFLVGVLRPTTASVVEVARDLERHLSRCQTRPGRFVGLAICPPIEAGADQSAILGHYESVLDATTSSVAVYELPQVTHCSIAPETLNRLGRNKRIVMFKDTSGNDAIAPAVTLPGVAMVRGAEGRYLEMLKPAGPYDGWLLSTGNVFGGELRRLLALQAEGRLDEGRDQSGRLDDGVQELFAAASGLDFGNPFSNANRAADHVAAYGSGWRKASLPLTRSGRRLPADLVAVAERVLGKLGRRSDVGYLGRVQGQVTQ